jgi:uncharacterized protein (TIGR02246 family)
VLEAWVKNSLKLHQISHKHHSDEVTRLYSCVKVKSVERCMSARSPQQIHTLFLDAFNRADVDSLVALYEPDAVLATRSGPAIGHEGIRAAYQQILAGGGRMELETRSVLESGDGLAVLHGAWTLYRNDSTISGLSTEVVRRQADGRWLFVLDEPRTPE